jgi:hypothetical protein
MNKFTFDLLAQLNTTPLPRVTSGPDRLQTIAQFAFGVIAAVAVLIVVIGGLRYILANGDSNKMSQAKSTILYAVIGLAISLSAFVIVTFVARGVS